MYETVSQDNTSMVFTVQVDINLNNIKVPLVE